MVIPILFGLSAAIVILLGAQGIRLMRGSLVDDLLQAENSGIPDAGTRVGPFTRVVDFFGRLTQRFLLNIYGAERVRRLSWQLRAAGQPAGLTAQVFMLLAVLNGQTLIGVAVGVLFVVWMHSWLYLTARRRQEMIERDLPDFLDVLAVTVAAGLPFRVALQRVSDQYSGPLTEEMRLTLREMQLGVPRRDALEGLRERTRSDSTSAFVTALLQSEELGTPLEEALKQIAQEVRRQRGQQVRRAAAKAQPKVSLVVTMFIVPGAIILIVGGMLLNNISMIKGLFNG